MIKVETIGMLDIAKINPVLVSESDVANYSFLVDDGDTYLIANTLVGDDSYREDVVIKAGEYLNGYLVKAWEGQKLVIDGKHVTGGISSINVKDELVLDGSTGKLKKEAPSANGVYFKVTDKTTLTEAALKVKVCVKTDVAAPGVGG